MFTIKLIILKAVLLLPQPVLNRVAVPAFTALYGRRGVALLREQIEADGGLR